MAATASGLSTLATTRRFQRHSPLHWPQVMTSTSKLRFGRAAQSSRYRLSFFFLCFLLGSTLRIIPSFGEIVGCQAWHFTGGDEVLAFDYITSFQAEASIVFFLKSMGDFFVLVKITRTIWYLLMVPKVPFAGGHTVMKTVDCFPATVLMPIFPPFGWETVNPRAQASFLPVWIPIGPGTLCLAVQQKAISIWRPVLPPIAYRSFACFIQPGLLFFFFARGEEILPKTYLFAVFQLTATSHRPIFSSLFPVPRVLGFILRIDTRRNHFTVSVFAHDGDSIDCV